MEVYLPYIKNAVSKASNSREKVKLILNNSLGLKRACDEKQNPFNLF